MLEFIFIVVGFACVVVSISVINNEKLSRADLPDGDQRPGFWERYWTLILGVTLSILGIALLLHFDPKLLLLKVLYAGVTEIGFAFIIAWVVGLTVELGARKEYNEYIQSKERLLSRNVFSYLYNNRLPRVAFDQIETHVFKQPVIKTSQRIDYSFPSDTDNDGWILVKCIYDYEVENISDTTQQYPLKFHISDPTAKDEPSGLSAKTVYFRIGEKEYSDKQISEMNGREPDKDGQIRYSTTLVLEPGEKQSVRAVCLMPKRVNDNLLFKHGVVCLQTDLVIRYDRSRYDVFVEAVSPHEHFTSFSANTDHTGCLEASFNEPMLPKHGVFVWWDSSKKEVPQVADGSK